LHGQNQIHSKSKEGLGFHHSERQRKLVVAVCNVKIGLTHRNLRDYCGFGIVMQHSEVAVVQNTKVALMSMMGEMLQKTKVAVAQGVEQRQKYPHKRVRHAHTFPAMEPME
jgi:hypothetical protein